MDGNDIHARTTTEVQLIERAIKDAAFRAELLADPKAVFVRELGLTMPDSVAVEVLEETPSTVYLVLPQASDRIGDELSDAELENVAGGLALTRGGCWTASRTCRGIIGC